MLLQQNEFFSVSTYIEKYGVGAGIDRQFKKVKSRIPCRDPLAVKCTVISKFTSENLDIVPIYIFISSLDMEPVTVSLG